MEDGDWNQVRGNSVVGGWDLTDGAQEGARAMCDGSQDEIGASRVNWR
jgi:hypothetical protein